MPRSTLPAWLGYGLTGLLVFAPVINGGTTYVPATLIRLASLALGIAWLWFVLGRDGAWRTPTPLDLPVTLFVALAAASTLMSSYPYLSLQVFLALASGALVLAVAAEVGREPRRARWLAGMVVLGGLAQALLALGQRLAGGVARPAGTYFNPNHLATALAMTGALLLASQSASRMRGWAARAAFVLVGAALVATGSRGGILAALAGWGLVGWYRWRWRALAVAAALAIGLAVVPNPLANRLKYIDAHDPFAYTRFQIWRSAIQRGLDHPLGVGLNLFGQSSQHYAFPIEAEVARYGRRAESAHNDYLQIFAELGPLGLALALWGLIALAGCAHRLRREPCSGVSGTLGLGAAGALTALAAQALVDTPLQVPGLVVQAAALAGLLAADQSRAAAGAMPLILRRVPRQPARIAFVALGCVAAIGIVRHGLAYFAYDRAHAERAAAGPMAALPWLGRAAALAPESAAYPDALAGTALAAWRASHDPKLAVVAEQGLLRAIALDPLDAGHRARLALVYREIVPADPALRRHVLERAKALYEEAEMLNPYEAMLPFARAELLAQLGDQDGALVALEQAIALEPRLLPVRLRLARMRAARGERAAAEAQYVAIEAALAAYQDRSVRDGFAAEFLAVDQAAVHREAAALREGSS